MLKSRHFKLVKGKAFGFMHASIVFPVVPPGQISGLGKQVVDVLSVIGEPLGIEAGIQLDLAARPENQTRPDWFIPLLNGLLIAAHLPLLGHKVLREADTIFLACETFDPAFQIACLNFLQDALKDAADKPDQVRSGLASLKEKTPAIFRSTNVRHLVRAAHDLGVPVCRLPNGILNFGMGVRSLAMQSTMTSRTSALGVRIARDKAATRELLAMAGLPVTDQRVAGTLAVALASAREIGYPVIVKPRSLDGGKGVTTNISDDAKLEAAFLKVSALSEAALVERHVPGNEYRLLFINGQLLSIHERVPAHVIGNGVNKVANLIEAENRSRAAAAQTGFTDIRIHVDDDTHAVLAAQKLDMGSIPAEGQKVRLATVPKVATGGEARLVDPSQFHPDVLAAARKAVHLTRLDVAGVDFITTDPSRPWRETGGVITEVNACPQINRFKESNIHQKVIRALIEGEGRVPSVLLIAGGEDVATLLNLLVERLATFAESVGVVVTDPSARGASGNHFALVTAPDGAPALLANPVILAVVTVAPLSYLEFNGFPIDRFDLAAVLEPAGPVELAKLSGPILRPHFSGRLLLGRSHQAPVALRNAFRADALGSYQNESDLVSRVARVLRGNVETQQPEADEIGIPVAMEKVTE